MIRVMNPKDDPGGNGMNGFLLLNYCSRQRNCHCHCHRHCQKKTPVLLTIYISISMPSRLIPALLLSSNDTNLPPDSCMNFNV